MVHVLLAAGAKIDFEDETRKAINPLSCAVSGCHVEVARVLFAARVMMHNLVTAVHSRVSNKAH